VAPGTVIVWTNLDYRAHSVTADMTNPNPLGGV